MRPVSSGLALPALFFPVLASVVLFFAACSTTSPSPQDLLRSAQQGNAVAQYRLGVIYENGYGVAKDYTKAAKWYRKSAAQSYAKAEFRLGYLWKL